MKHEPIGDHAERKRISALIERCRKEQTMWNAEIDACADCKNCEYFLHEFWNCQGDTKKCDEYIVARMKGADDETD